MTDKEEQEAYERFIQPQDVDVARGKADAFMMAVEEARLRYEIAVVHIVTFQMVKGGEADGCAMVSTRAVGDDEHYPVMLAYANSDFGDQPKPPGHKMVDRKRGQA